MAFQGRDFFFFKVSKVADFLDSHTEKDLSTAVF